MKFLAFGRWSLGVKLSVITSLSVAALFLVLTLALTNNASNQMQALTLENMENQVDGIGDMATMFNSTLSEEVANYTALFQSFLPKQFTLDATQRVAIGAEQAPVLRAGDRTLNLDETLVDDFFQRTGAISTIFVRDGDDFLRVSTSLKKENGDRAIGTRLDRNAPAWKLAQRGEIFQGVAMLFGKRYITQYQPVKDASGQVVGILFVGVDITKQYALIREKVLSKKLGESGRFSVLNDAEGKSRGQYVFHPEREGQLPTWPEATRQLLLSQDSGKVEVHGENGETQIMAWHHLPDWHWVILGEVNKASLLAPIQHTRNLFLTLGAALVALFALGFITTTHRWVSKPLQQVIELAEHYSAGNLQATLETQRHDEVGKLIGPAAVRQGRRFAGSRRRGGKRWLLLSQGRRAAEGESRVAGSNAKRCGKGRRAAGGSRKAIWKERARFVAAPVRCLSTQLCPFGAELVVRDSLRRAGRASGEHPACRGTAGAKFSTIDTVPAFFS